MLGTPSYMPRQASGRLAQLDERSDAWSPAPSSTKSDQAPPLKGAAVDVVEASSAIP